MVAYDEGEIDTLVDFEYEKKKAGNQNDSIRYFCFCLICVPYITLLMFCELKNFFRPFTNWTLMISTINLVYFIFFKTEKKTIHCLYSVSFIANFIVMVVYWSMLHWDLMKEVGSNKGKVVHLCLVHTLPGIATYINAYISNVRLKQSFWKVITAICLIYCTFAYVYWT